MGLIPSSRPIPFQPNAHKQIKCKEKACKTYISMYTLIKRKWVKQEYCSQECELWDMDLNR